MTNVNDGGPAPGGHSARTRRSVQLMAAMGSCVASFLVASIVFGTSIALLSLVFLERERGKTIGINVTSMFLGFTAGLLAGGLLTFYLSWRYIFVITAVLASATLYLVRTRVRGECELARDRSFDSLSMGFLSVGMLLFFFGLSEVTRPLGWYVLAAGALALHCWR